MDLNDDVILKINKIDPMVYEIINEAYHEVLKMYGNKHGGHIREVIENTLKECEMANVYFTGPTIASIHSGDIHYTKTDKLHAAIKHELWHSYNSESSDKSLSLQHIPQRYIDALEKSGDMRKLYEDYIMETKEKFKDDSERVKELLVDYDEWKQKKFELGPSHYEMWTEWFSCQTHLKDMKDNFWDWNDGFFTKNHSSGSFYNAYLNIASMISCIIPKDKLLEMYLHTSDYKTDYSYPEMQEEFDSKYSDALEPDEQLRYGFPYLKILMDIRTIHENARNKPEVAKQALQSCMKTCFNAYLIKLNNIKALNVQEAQDLFAEIKYMQENMLWNADFSKMEGLDYIQSLISVQNKFKELAGNLDLENPEVKEMLENIDYTKENPFQVIESRIDISKQIGKEQEEKNNAVVVGDGKVIVGQNGIKDNLYSSLFIVLGDEKYNLLFKKNEQDNILQDISAKIKSASTEQEIVQVYREIYKIYEQKLKITLKTDENLDSKFEKYASQIVELQKNGIFNLENKAYLPELEEVIHVYNERLNEYMVKIDIATEEKIQLAVQRGRRMENAKEEVKRIANGIKSKLQEKRKTIETQRQEQAEVLMPKEDEYPIGAELEDSCEKIAREQKARDIISGQNELKENYNEIDSPTMLNEDEKI